MRLSAINITPPSDDPATVIPIAAPRFFLKYCAVDVVAGAIIIPMDKPPRTPWATINCQYVLHRLVIIVANTNIAAGGHIT